MLILVRRSNSYLISALDYGGNAVYALRGLGLYHFRRMYARTLAQCVMG